MTNQNTTRYFLQDEKTIRQLMNTSEPVSMIKDEVTHKSSSSRDENGIFLPALPSSVFGDARFCETYGTKYAFYAGAMANAIASVDMVIALGKQGMMGSFGAAGLVRPKLEAAVDQIQKALPDGPYAFNLINSPYEEALERNAVEVYLAKKVRVIEASAYLTVSPTIVWYRAAGLSKNPAGSILINNHVIAKVSRNEVASKFMEPAPEKILTQLVADGRITREQAELARLVPMADDITVEGDSGGHTDNRPLVCLLPTMLALRDEMQAQYNYAQPVRIGAAGGISTPSSVLGAFMMGAAYVVTGSVNQACVESGASKHTKDLLSQISMADVAMAPSADMFEMGVKVQVLKRGTMFYIRASKLYEIYSKYDSIEAIPVEEREKLEKQIFQRNMDDIWNDTVSFFKERDPQQIELAVKNPKKKMALVFRWYLGLSSRWSNSGEPGREMDYQIWCGPSMGSFNDWTRPTYMAKPENRFVADVTAHLFAGAAWQYRVQQLKLAGIDLPSKYQNYYPENSLVQ
jgi:PfaD family protein